MQLINGETIKEMSQLPDNSIDMILCDLPYGTTPLKWDKLVPADAMWSQYNRIIKPNGAIVLFGSQPFTSMLVASNYRHFKHEIIWEKQRASNFMQVKTAPLKYHENILVFGTGKSGLKTFNPQKYPVIEIDEIMNYDKKQMTDFLVNKKYDQFGKVDHRKTIKDGGNSTEFASGGQYRSRNKDTGFRNPKSIVKFNKPLNNNVHPTQKPVPLLEYLIKTYSNECDVILDNTMGSGSTGVACINTNRDFIGIELDEKYFKIAEKRINEQLENKK
mgnify:CR=1 FL=1